MSEKYTILFFCLDAAGHMNACIGHAGQLRDRGHKIVFAAPNAWRGKLEPMGFIEEPYVTAPEMEGSEFNDKWGEMIKVLAPALPLPSLEQCNTLMHAMIQVAIGHTKFAEPRIKEIVNRVKPDVIVADTTFHLPCLFNVGIPWIFSNSLNPISINPENVPPAFSGLPIDADKSIWKDFADKRKEAYNAMFQDYKTWVLEHGGPEIHYNFPHFMTPSPYANIYMYPIELDYTAYRPNPPKFHQFDAFVRITNETFEIPQELKNLSGKLIYFSLGTIGTSELGLMRRLIGILGKSPHRFIVSKGPLADKIELPANMWGAASVPQTKVLPLVDLVITHGGNNTITESFYFGKRVLVLPLFADQWDNGQRIQETGLGLQFRPYAVTEEELLGGIETLLKDQLLERRMIAISKRIQASNGQAKAADVIEEVARCNKTLLEHRRHSEHFS